jgi:large subunit ribosomal protein L25
MPMQILKAAVRNENGKKVKNLRKAGFVPSVVYGPKTPNESVSVSLNDFEKVYREAGESSLVELHVGSKKIPVIISEITRDPVTSKMTHADFYAVDMKKAIHAKVPLTFVGESPAVKSEGGILLKVMQEIEIEALPENLPHEISVFIDSLTAIGDRITAGALVMPEGVKLKANPEDTIVIVEAPRTEEEVLAAAAVPAEAVVEVKTEQEIKKAEKEAKKQEEEAAA